MADEEAEQERNAERGVSATTQELRRRLQQVQAVLVRDSTECPGPSSSRYCEEFCRTLLKYADRWSMEEDPLRLMEVYMEAVVSYAQASTYLSLQCENVPLVLERLCLSFVELLLSLKEEVPDDLWNQFKLSVQFAHCKLQDSGVAHLALLAALSHQTGVWTNCVLQGLLSNDKLPTQQVEEFLELEGPVLMEMRVKQLMKKKEMEKAAMLAKICSESSAFQGRGAFRQMLLVCICATSQNQQLMDELLKVDCRDALDMICNLESDGDDRAAFSLCSAFLTRQLLQADTYCAWELTLFWSKLLKRLEPSEQDFLDRCRQMSLLSKTVYHILFLIKVIQSEMDSVGLPVCIEMCIRALQMESSDGNTKVTVCKTISCLLPADLEVKRACQLTEFLLEPTVDSYYAVEAVYNEPDQKVEEENMPVPNSLRCELLLVFKTQWSFDPEFWDWKTLKRHCLALMGEEASIVSSIDLLNDAEGPEEEEESFGQEAFNFTDVTNEEKEITDKRQKNRELKKLREKGFISTRFRNWQAYMQYCVLCDKEFLGHRIVRHAQTHFKDGVYSCPICVETFATKETLVPHVASHVKLSCKERLSAMKTNQKLANPRTAAPVMAALKAKTENGLIYKEHGEYVGLTTFQSRVAGCHVERNEENTCPVGNCRKTFKFFKNLIAHVKAHGDNEEAKRFLDMQSKKVVCQYCRRQFVSVSHLNDHLQVHCGVKPYICIQLNCKASFLSKTELLLHRKDHVLFKARCMFPKCGKVFNEAYKLYDHEAQHYATFTCKFQDCGKLFHSQSQLDLHQEEHANQKEEEPVSEHQTSQTEPGLSLAVQMLSDPSNLRQEISQDSEKCKNESVVYPAESIQSLLQSSHTHTQSFGQEAVHSRPQVKPFSPSQTHSSDHSVIQSHPLPHRDTSNAQSFNCLKPAQQNQPIPPFSANTGELSHTCITDIVQSQTQMFPSNVSYNSDCSLPLPQQLQAIYRSNLLTAAPPQDAIETIMSQPLPPTATPLPLPVNPVTSSTSTAPPTSERERYHCAFETCTRHYSCYRSVAKHMKTAHPEFYEQWKLARTKIKITHTAAQSTLPVGNSISVALHENQQCSRVPVNGLIQPPTYTNTIPPPLPSSVQSASLLMENVLNPIVLSQLGSDTNSLLPAHSQAAGGINWNSESGNDKSQNCSTSQVYPSNTQIFPQVETSGAPEPSIPSCSVIGSNMSRAGKHMQSPLIESSRHSVLRSFVDVARNAKQIALFTPQMQSCSVTSSRAPENAKAVQLSVQSADPSSNAAYLTSSDNQSKNDPAISENSPNCSRRSRRAKWPAILQDGKFVCCRCFRKFDSPTSLGGHLSKRSTCKSFEETELNTDLPTSFLDLLNSEQTVSTPQPQLSFNPATLYQEKLCQTDSSGSTGPKNYTTPNYPQANMPACGNLQSNDILKQIMAESNMSDLFVQPPFPQPLFQSRCVPFGAAEHLPGSSVIQHTENVQVKREDRSCSKGLYPQPRVDAFAAPEFPGTLLSQILRENSCAALTRSVPTNHVTAREVLSDGYRSETTSQTPDTHPHPVKQIRLPDAQLSPASTNSKRGETQDIKKILREQILAGDFQRRNNSCLTGNTDPNASIKGPMSLGPLSSLPKVPGLHQISQGAKSVIMSASSDEMEGLLRSKSFTCFREASVPQHEVRSPASIEATDVDSGPALSFASQQPWMMEIQSAFERLDLVREKSDQTSPFGRNNSNNLQSETVSPKVSSQNSALSALFKPFTCESQNCTFSSMSGDSLWRHLSKTHNYTNEMVNVVKKRYQQYAPFRCQKCNKTFTRNSNLRTHYLSAHKLSLEEIADLDIKRKLATSAIIQNQSGNSINPVSAPHSSNENRVTVKREYPLPAFLQYSSTGVTKQKVQDNYCSTVRPPSQTAPRHSQASAAKAQSSTLALQSQQADGTAAERWSDGPQTPPSKVATQHVGLQQFGAHLSKAATVVSQDSPAVPPSAEKPSAMRQTVKLNSDITKKTKDRKPDTDNAFSPYRPYRCVHQGCVAAFTIQRNLILHYRAVHQSALSALVQSEGPDEYKDHDEEDTEVDAPQASEFRCQEKDCSGVFQEVLSLLQHYLQLHEFSLERAGALLSSINLGKFACGHQGCTASFTTFWKYVGHVKEQHQDIKLSKVEPLNGTFKCNIEGCDRAYATKSNLLRHVVKKHRDVHQPKRIKRQMMEDGVKQNSKNCHYQIIKTSNGKENIESNKKIPQRGSEMKRISKRKRNHWITYGKPSLKSQEEAAAMCTKAFPLQYPCMIEGCESVMNSERNITKHYVGHGLTEKYLEEQRSHFIFCKKFPSKKYCSIRSDDSKSDNTSDLSENEIKAGLEGSKYRYSKPDLRKKTAAVFDESSEPGSDSSMVVKRKRGRPRKLEEKIVKRKKIPRSTKNHVVYSRDDESDSSCPAFLQEEKSERSVPLASFKPMGFEMSFLKFLEQSKNSEYPMKKFEMPETVRKTASSSCTCVQFSNRQNVKSLCKVKIVVDEAFSGVAELTLKQLQDLRPTVVLEKNDFNNLRSRMT